MKIKILSLICLIGLLGSCNKWLDMELDDTVDQVALFKTEQGFIEALAGVYSQMSQDALYGSNLTYKYLDVYAQYYNYASMEDHPTYGYFVHYDYENAGSRAVQDGIWYGLYNCIAGCNNILHWLDKNGKVVSAQNRDQIRGEALALRAYLHFDLLRMFAPNVRLQPQAKGIPYNKKFGVALPPAYTVEETTQLVINDLLEAEKLLANDPIMDVVPYTFLSKDLSDRYVARINLYGVKAILARVHLQRGDRENAIKYAEEVIESGKFRLLDFLSVDKNDDVADVLFSDEHIFSLRNSEIVKLSTDLHIDKKDNKGTMPAPLVPGDASVIYETNNDDMRYAKWIILEGGKFSKYNKTDNYKTFYPKVPMIKLSEMYLILTEAYYETNFTKAVEMINTLRDHRIRNNAHWTMLTRDYIFDEMRREYFGEGQLWFQYKRLNKGVITSGSVGVIPPSDNIFIFPIPRSESNNSDAK